MQHDHSKPLSPEEDAIVAAEALSEGDLQHAIYHLAGAIYADPERRDWRELLARVFVAAPDPVALVPLRPQGIWAGEALIRALALDWVGRKTEALSVLLQVAAQPNPRILPVLAAAAEGPAVQTQGAQRWNQFFGAWIQRLPGLRVEEAQRPVVEHLLPLAEIVVAAWPEEGSLSGIFLALLRKSGHDVEALRLGPGLYAAAPGWAVAGMMAQLHQARGELPEARRWYEAVLSHRPDHPTARCELADLWLESGDLAQAARTYAEVLEREPGESWALPSYQFCRAMLGQTNARTDIERLAQAGNARASQLVVAATPWCAYIPGPTEAGARTVAEALGQGILPSTIVTDTPEAPSSYLGTLLELKRRGLEGTVEMAVASTAPARPDGLALWAVAVPAVAPPGDEVAKAVRILASQPYGLQRWSEAANRLASALQPAVAELLGAMVHPSEAPPQLDGWTWVRRNQLAAALVLGHRPEGPAVLERLLFGPMDWTVDVAAVVLAQLVEEGTVESAKIQLLFEERAESLPEGPCCWWSPLLESWLRLPGLTGARREELRDWRGEIR